MNNYVKKFINLVFKHQKVRDWLVWGILDENGCLVFTLVKDMTDEDIQEVLNSLYPVKCFYRREFKNELKLRKKFPELSRERTT